MKIKTDTILKDLKDFFEIDAPNYKLILIGSREKLDKMSGHKTEPWITGTII